MYIIKVILPTGAAGALSLFTAEREVEEEEEGEQEEDAPEDAQTWQVLNTDIQDFFIIHPELHKEHSPNRKMGQKCSTRVPSLHLTEKRGK